MHYCPPPPTQFQWGCFILPENNLVRSNRVLSFSSLWWRNRTTTLVSSFWILTHNGKDTKDRRNRWRQLQTVTWLMVDIVRASPCVRLWCCRIPIPASGCCHGQQCIEGNKKERKWGETQPSGRLWGMHYKLCYTLQYAISKFRKAVCTCQQYCWFLVSVFPIKYVLYGLLLTKLHRALFREERSGKTTAETFPFGACTHCCAVCISVSSPLPSAREWCGSVVH